MAHQTKPILDAISRLSLARFPTVSLILEPFSRSHQQRNLIIKLLFRAISEQAIIKKILYDKRMYGKKKASTQSDWSLSWGYYFICPKKKFSRFVRKFLFHHFKNIWSKLTATHFFFQKSMLRSLLCFYLGCSFSSFSEVHFSFFE